MRNRFPYAQPNVGAGITIKRPNIEVVLSFDGGGRGPIPTPGIDALIDTGSDYCMFDWYWATCMRIDPRNVGLRTSIGGIGGTAEAWRVPGVSMHIPELAWTTVIDAYFLRFTKTVCGVLGHAGFLDELTVTFHRGEYFEITDDRKAPVEHLKPV